MIKAVIFDMDGTILDTITDITTASNNALEAMGLPHHFTRDEVKLCFGSGIHDDIAKIIALARGCQGQDLIDLCETIPASRYAVTEEEIQKCRAIFSDLYPRNHRKTSPYEGIPELLKKLREKGIKTAVASNKDEAPVKKLTEMYLKGLFDIVNGNKPDIHRKPAPDMINAILSDLSLTPEDAIYVGDTEVDIETARNSHLPCLSVTWGFRPETFLRARGGKHFVNHPLEILDFVEKE